MHALARRSLASNNAIIAPPSKVSKQASKQAWIPARERERDFARAQPLYQSPVMTIINSLINPPAIQHFDRTALLLLQPGEALITPEFSHQAARWHRFAANVCLNPTYVAEQTDE